MAPGGTGTRAAERSTERTATGRSHQSDPARETAANPPRAGDTGPSASGKAAGPTPAVGTAPPKTGSIAGATHPGASDAPSPGKAPPAAAGAGEARRLSRGPGVPPQTDRPRQAGPIEGIVRSSPDGDIATQGSARTKTRGPDDAGIAEAQPTDLTGLATPARAPEPRNIAAPETVQPPASSAVAIAEQVADRILVAAPEPGTSGEVRISLGESVLDGSDVRIFREGENSGSSSCRAPKRPGNCSPTTARCFSRRWGNGCRMNGCALRWSCLARARPVSRTARAGRVSGMSPRTTRPAQLEPRPITDLNLERAANSLSLSGRRIGRIDQCLVVGRRIAVDGR